MPAGHTVALENFVHLLNKLGRIVYQTLSFTSAKFREYFHEALSTGTFHLLSGISKARSMLCKVASQVHFLLGKRKGKPRSDQVFERMCVANGIRDTDS
jgi:hypothetical protein